MTFKPRKSRSMIIRKRKITDKYDLLIQGEIIPSIKDNPIKCLGKWYNESLKDKNNVHSTEKQVEGWLKNIEKSGLPGKFKAWLHQHGLLPRLMWLMMVYKVPLTALKEWSERSTSTSEGGLESLQVSHQSGCKSDLGNYNYPCHPLLRSSGWQSAGLP